MEISICFVMYKPGRPRKYYPSTGKGSTPPSVPGEYRIRDKNGKIKYIGETNNLNRRMREHKRCGKMSGGQIEDGSFEFKTADRRSSSITRREHERQKIAQHNPVLNLSRGGEGRRAQRRGKNR